MCAINNKLGNCRQSGETRSDIQKNTNMRGCVKRQIRLLESWMIMMI
jgi:hypothetical protein